MKKLIAATAIVATGLSMATAKADETVFVGHLMDITGATGFIGKFYADGVRDALSYVNTHGGIQGTTMDFESVDYAYKVPQAIANYKKWRSRNNMIAMQGWGTGDTEALISFVAQDQVPVYSASYSGHLTDPTGKNPKTAKPAPYNFFYGASYSDACRALAQWAAEDWKASGGEGEPVFTHIGDNHPYPNAPKEACAEYATELGFRVTPAVTVSMAPGDFKAQCLTLKESGTNYGYLGNLGPSVVSLVKSCGTVGTELKWLANIWAGDYETLKTIGDVENYVFPAMTSFWTDEGVPGMDLVREISKVSDPSGEQFRTHHYIRGICSVYYMKEAMEWAKDNGGITGANIKQGMYARTDWVPEGLDGVCLPASWTAEDHRGINTVSVYIGSAKNGVPTVTKANTVTLPRRDDWLGY
ncbi:ABC transporter substrate-binding protein [Thalassospira sp.]|uniref:ABC transporter substrate-binding protein n=1 Tax=Thalassospira sp. TaxID=1912094 RepID=UPI002733666A|nr:ABC transporter substrate-binding protein [Thalassospira sp.]MDP2697334.1 ABC transporter substrate-binding protein [Thalassospira sp.]